jgi:uncharacterized protein YndB with AHSA1/START domain/DNA-binding transcriptional ArsR family regulator
MKSVTAPMDRAWRALSDPSRRRLLDLLREGPRTTGDLCGRFRTTRVAVMKHLAVLERARLVLVERRGRERWNHLNAVPLRRIHDRWISSYEAHWASSLLGLKGEAEGRTGGSAMGEATKTAADAPRTVHIEQEVAIGAPPEKVFDALTKRTAAWWGAPYLLGKPEDLVMELRPGGRFYEVWGADEGALWATVSRVQRPGILELVGAMGMGGAVQGHLVFKLEPRGKGTVLRFSHRMMGQIPEGRREEYGAGWKDLLGVRLKAFVEEGTRFGLGHAPPPAVATGG